MTTIPATATVVSRELVSHDPFASDLLAERVVFTQPLPCGCVHETTLFDGEVASFTVSTMCPACEQAAEDAYNEDVMLAEIAAEAANERFWENRGYDEARLQEEMEARMGIFC